MHPGALARNLHPLRIFTEAYMGAKLHIQPAAVDPFEVRIGNTATIGRTRENTVCLNFSPLVSRQHAMIRCHNGFQYQLIDLGSRNGTFVNDQRVIMPVTLSPGSVIRIADNSLTFQEEVAEESEDTALTVAATMTGSGGALATRPVALLVCDIRGFSRMSEHVPAGDVAQLLGQWFRETGNVVQQRQGIVDKFLGDALLAYWATTQQGASDCTAALETALDFLRLASSLHWPNGEPLGIVVALHYGRVTFGNVGLAAERDATIIGDPVNTVFRLEGVTKEVGARVLLSEDFARQLPPGLPLRDFGPRELKGKQQHVRVFGWEGQV